MAVKALQKLLDKKPKVTQGREVLSEQGVHRVGRAAPKSEGPVHSLTGVGLGYTSRSSLGEEVYRGAMSESRARLQWKGSLLGSDRHVQMLDLIISDMPSIPLGGLEVVVVAATDETRSEPSGSPIRHRHGWHSLIAIVSGALEYEIEGRAICLDVGDLLVLPAGLLHSWRSLALPVVMRGLLCEISAGSAAGTELLENVASIAAAAGYRYPRSPELIRACDRLFSRSEAQKPLFIERVRTLVTEFVIEALGPVLGRHLERTRADQWIPLESLHDQAVRGISSYVAGNLHRRLVLEEIAAQVHLSVRHMNRIFHQNTGMSVGRYVVQKKMLAAQERLARTDYTIKVIASDLGYAEIAAFYRCFRGVTGLTPAVYRARALRMAQPEAIPGASERGPDETGAPPTGRSRWAAAPAPREGPWGGPTRARRHRPGR